MNHFLNRSFIFSQILKLTTKIDDNNIDIIQC